MGRATLIVGIILWPCAGAAAQETKSKEMVRFEEGWLMKHVHQYCQPKAGVKLRTSAKVVGEKIEIRWTISYDGERAPLNILRPMPPERDLQSTNVCIYLPKTAEEARLISLSRNLGLNQGQRFSQPAREEFLSIPKGKSANGKLTVSLRSLKKEIRSQLSAPPDRLPEVLYISLRHAPWARGAEYGLDAFALSYGFLESVPERVLVERWP